MPSKNDRHKKCPSCKHNGYRKPCPSCGKIIRFASKVCALCQGKKRSKNLNHKWKGGRFHNSNGYLLSIDKQHPHTGNNGYVLEHRLIMESLIGRFLANSENVHHLNGIRDDNRPENLELWTRPQPSGIRVKDAIIWAKELLKKYGSDETKY